MTQRRTGSHLLHSSILPELSLPDMKAFFNKFYRTILTLSQGQTYNTVPIYTPGFSFFLACKHPLPCFPLHTFSPSKQHKGSMTEKQHCSTPVQHRGAGRLTGLCQAPLNPVLRLRQTVAPCSSTSCRCPGENTAALVGCGEICKYLEMCGANAKHPLRAEMRDLMNQRKIKGCSLGGRNAPSHLPHCHRPV